MLRKPIGDPGLSGWALWVRLSFDDQPTATIAVTARSREKASGPAEPRRWRLAGRGHTPGSTLALKFLPDEYSDKAPWSDSCAKPARICGLEAGVTD
jgi:hypothetical protein